MQKRLTQKEERFCVEYIKTGNATQSALKAGYAESTARNEAEKILRRAHIAERIGELTQAQHSADIADIQEVMSYLSGVMRGQVRDAFGLDPSLQERTRAAQELMRRYAAADQRHSGALAKLDDMLTEFREAVQDTAQATGGTLQPPANPRPLQTPAQDTTPDASTGGTMQADQPPETSPATGDLM